MRIGELAERTGTSRRLLRYYEEQGLLVPDRSANGYREYDDTLVDQVVRIRGLLAAGVPTKIIRQILPCLTEREIVQFSGTTEPILTALERERDQMSERIEFLTRNRDAITGYITAVKSQSRTGY
ncbi:MerR family transcriptional regulator [Actinocrispum wychmicini]|uniref:DNA-binding transcriptional MerR regulator n=1 Tax=Actinocrispum wychmicini TaxID=1213861 RepID=A0A4R2IUF6_9PSEU|nr:MerR family transcriptional regulator [Actinocrispum wychmicini]TCO48056.1 DNA-binding transcriptional MerR regulator [Actinocrispum wychmicini]